MKLTERQVLEQFDIVTRKQLRQWVHSGWIVPAQGERGPSFDDVDVARIRLVCELRRDMNVNDDAVPIILALLDQLYGLRRELRTIATALLEQPDEVRQHLKQALLSPIGQQH
ncbi:chaperone modulator CbpM [Sinorhizobium meliloti]|nr:chaperone modulator CbpM [Sinorhizobium meliloti]WQP16446.1 chaperone modulator CbpM [Sinorhizobium meliloti]WQP29883.1 chaperone modulator CbpM [Sinorhizobium meliloti]